MKDIRYCTYSNCKNKQCERHINNIPKRQEYSSFVDFRGVCKYYIRKLLKEIEKEM